MTKHERFQETNGGHGYSKAKPAGLLTTQKQGTAAELIACAWLILQGYEVFRNVCSVGFTDIVAIKKREIFRFDVKTALHGKTALSDEQYKLGILPLYVSEGGVCEIGNNPLRELNVILSRKKTKIE